MLKYWIIVALCQLGLVSVSCYQKYGFSSQFDLTCILPEFPEYGHHNVLGDTADTLPGADVPNLTVIQYQCDVGYVPYPHSTAVCNGRTWDTEFTECQRRVTCPSPINPAHGSYELSNSGCPLKQGAEVPNWSAVIYSCDATYEIVGNRAAVCQNGLWSSEPPQCQKSTQCILPNLPETGSYSIVGSQEAPKPGAVIAEKEALRYNCIASNGGATDQVIVCSKGKWVPGVVKCGLPTSCADVSGSRSGIYVIQPTKNSKPLEVYCDLTLAKQKWIVIQKRLNEDVIFYRNYKEYSAGFGCKSGNHWLGLQNIHEITKGGGYELYVDLEAHNGTKGYARYSTFSVGNSSTGFQLKISGYSGTAGDSMTRSSGKHNLNGMKFSTFDKDQDLCTSNCAEIRQGAWWFNSCSDSNLNGPYYNTAVEGHGNKGVMHWGSLIGWRALKISRMLIRRK